MNRIFCSVLRKLSVGGSHARLGSRNVVGGLKAVEQQLLDLHAKRTGGQAVAALRGVVDAGRAGDRRAPGGLGDRHVLIRDPHAGARRIQLGIVAVRLGQCAADRLGRGRRRDIRGNRQEKYSGNAVTQYRGERRRHSPGSPLYPLRRIDARFESVNTPHNTSCEFVKTKRPTGKPANLPRCNHHDAGFGKKNSLGQSKTYGTDCHLRPASFPSGVLLARLGHYEMRAAVAVPHSRHWRARHMAPSQPSRANRCFTNLLAIPPEYDLFLPCSCLLRDSRLSQLLGYRSSPRRPRFAERW